MKNCAVRIVNMTHLLITLDKCIKRWYSIYMKNNNISTRRTVNAILGEDYTLAGRVHKKGSKVNALDLTLKGASFCMGHGWYENIPLDKFTSYVETICNTTTIKVGNTVTKTHDKVTKNVTDEWVKMWKKEQDKKLMAEINEKIKWLNIHIKNTTDMILEVNSGRAERKLKKLNSDLNEIKVGFGIK